MARFGKKGAPGADGAPASGGRAASGRRADDKIRLVEPDDPFNPRKGSGNALTEKTDPRQRTSMFGGRGTAEDDYTLSRESLQEDDVAKNSFRKYRLHKGEELSVYAEEMERRYGVDVRTKAMIGTAVVLFLVTLLAILVPNNSTAAHVQFSFAWLADGVTNSMTGLLAFLSGQRPDDSMQYKLFLYLIIALAGATLGISGAVYQGSMRNALASPTTLGVVAGGTLGMTIYVIFFYDATVPDSEVVTQASEMLAYTDGMSTMEYVAERYASLLCTLAGCFIVVAFVLGVALAAGRGRVSGPVLVITGQVVVMVITAVLSIVRSYFATLEGEGALVGDALNQSRSMTFSSMYTLLDLVLMAVPILVGVGIILALRIRLNALTFDEDEARSLGLSVNATRNLMVAACTLMTAVVIAFCGSIGFVGFLVPHLTRRLVGPDFNYLMPASALVGALFMVLTYFVSSFLALEAFGGTRILTSVLGGVVFVVMALRGRGRRSTTDAF